MPKLQPVKMSSDLQTVNRKSIQVQAKMRDFY